LLGGIVKQKIASIKSVNNGLDLRAMHLAQSAKCGVPSLFKRLIGRRRAIVWSCLREYRSRQRQYEEYSEQQFARIVHCFQLFTKQIKSIVTS